MSDLISRQAAIDWLKNEWDGMVTSVFKGIESLPSAQPEIIRCKDCKWWSKKPLTITRRCSIFDTDTDMTFFCKHGRREREKMANNRIWIKCKECEDKLYLGKSLGEGYFYRNYSAIALSDKLNEFYDKHDLCGENCFEIEYDEVSE